MTANQEFSKLIKEVEHGEDMQDRRRLSGVELINPFAADATARLAALLGE